MNKPFIVITPEVMANTDIKMIDNVLFKSPTEFSLFIESEAAKQKKTCTEIILEYCDEKDIDVDNISKLINESLKGKIEHEMIESGLLAKHTTLDGF